MVALPLVVPTLNVVDATPLELVSVPVGLIVPIVAEPGARENVTGIPDWGIKFISRAVTEMVTWLCPFATTHCWLDMIVELERSFAATGTIRIHKHRIAIIAKNNRITQPLI